MIVTEEIIFIWFYFLVLSINRHFRGPVGFQAAPHGVTTPRLRNAAAKVDNKLNKHQKTEIWEPLEKNNEEKKWSFSAEESPPGGGSSSRSLNWKVRDFKSLWFYLWEETIPVTPFSSSWSLML